MDIVQLTEILGNVGEFIGSIVVLVTLIYLAVQAKHSRELLEENRRIATAQMYTARANQTMELMTQNIESSYCSQLNAERNGEDEMAVKARAYDQRNILQLDCSLHMFELGLLRDEDITRIHAAILRQYPRWIESEATILPRLQHFIDTSGHV